MDQRKKLIRALHGFGAGLGLGHDSLHDFAEAITGKNSIGSLTVAELQKVIDRLVEMGKSKRHKANLIKLPSPNQKNYVSHLIRQIKDKGINIDIDGVSIKACKKKYSRLKSTEVQTLIEALKSILARSK